MYDPPTPILGRDKVASFAVHQTSGIEQRDCNAGEQEHEQERMALIAFCQGRFQSAPHEPKPENQSAEQQDLPNPAQIYILIALRTEPKPQVAKFVLNAHPLAGKRSNDNKDERPKKNIHAQPLAIRLDAAHSRSNVKTSCEPRGSNPEKSNLKMPSACHAVGQPAI